MDLASHVARGNAQRQDVPAWLSHPPLEEHDFRDKSKTWHDWRQALEYTIIARSFTRPDDLLSRLRMHRIEHMNCDVSPWQSRAQALPRDWSRDLEFVEDLRHRLPNHERHRGGV